MTVANWHLQLLLFLYNTTMDIIGVKITVSFSSLLVDSAGADGVSAGTTASEVAEVPVPGALNGSWSRRRSWSRYNS